MLGFLTRLQTFISPSPLTFDYRSLDVFYMRFDIRYALAFLLVGLVLAGSGCIGSSGGGSSTPSATDTFSEKSSVKTQAETAEDVRLNADLPVTLRFDTMRVVVSEVDEPFIGVITSETGSTDAVVVVPSDSHEVIETDGGYAVKIDSSDGYYLNVDYTYSEDEPLKTFHYLETEDDYIVVKSRDYFGTVDDTDLGGDIKAVVEMAKSADDLGEYILMIAEPNGEHMTFNQDSDDIDVLTGDVYMADEEAVKVGKPYALIYIVDNGDSLDVGDVTKNVAGNLALGTTIGLEYTNDVTGDDAFSVIAVSMDDYNRLVNGEAELNFDGRNVEVNGIEDKVFVLISR